MISGDIINDGDGARLMLILELIAPTEIGRRSVGAIYFLL